MVEFILTHYYRDVQNGETSRSFKGDFATEADAETAAALFDTDAIAASKSKLYKRTLAKVTPFAGAAAANTSVFDTVSCTVTLDTSGKKANINLPNPVDVIMTGNSLIIDALLYENYTENLEAGAGWTISDGEVINSTIRGARKIRSSGKTNLPS